MPTVVQHAAEIHDCSWRAAILEIDSMQILGNSHDIGLLCQDTCTE